MSKNRKMMMNKVIKTYGMEHEYTISFVRMCEDKNSVDHFIKVFYKDLMNRPAYTEAED